MYLMPIHSDLGSTGLNSRPNSDPGGINSPHTPSNSNQGMMSRYFLVEAYFLLVYIETYDTSNIK